MLHRIIGQLIFYSDDSRENLKVHLIDKNGINSLDDWISEMQKNGHSVYLSSDNVFANHICGGIDPKSHDRFSLYNYEKRETKSQVGSTTGFRSELKRSIDQEHAESLLPSLPTSHFIPESIGADYKHILDNVASESLFDRKLPKHLQEALNLDSDQINEIDLEKVIWRVHWELYELARKDPDIGSLDMHGNPIDQEGLTENERAEYR